MPLIFIVSLFQTSSGRKTVYPLSQFTTRQCAFYIILLPYTRMAYHKHTRIRAALVQDSICSKVEKKEQSLAPFAHAEFNATRWLPLIEKKVVCIYTVVSHYINVTRISWSWLMIQFFCSPPTKSLSLHLYQHRAACVHQRGHLSVHLSWHGIGVPYQHETRRRLLHWQVPQHEVGVANR